jgi:hypothetical protein
MNWLIGLLTRHAAAARLAGMALALLLAACNNGSDGGGPGY